MGIIGARRELLDRVLRAPQFAHAESLQRILRFLFDHTGAEGSPSLKEYDIAVSALRRPESFDPKLDAIIRVSIAGIRERLRAYFDGEGRDERLRLIIPKGQYRLIFAEAEPREHKVAPPAQPGSAVKQFWQPYLTGRAPNIILYNELLCYRDARGSFVRNIYVNDPAAGPSALTHYFPIDEPLEWKPSFHFVSGGEMFGVLRISDAFHEMNARVRIKNSRFISWADIERANLIVLGSSRTNSFLNSLQGEEEFQVMPDCIQNLKPQPGEAARYRGCRSMAGGLERVVDYAIVTRRPGLVGDSTVTLISGNHGRAMEGAMQFLTREEQTSGLLPKLRLEGGDLSAHFQVLFKVDMIDFDEEVMNVEPVSYRVS